MCILKNKLIPAVHSEIHIIRLTNFASDFSKVQYSNTEYLLIISHKNRQNI